MCAHTRNVVGLGSAQFRILNVWQWNVVAKAETKWEMNQVNQYALQMPSSVWQFIFCIISTKWKQTNLSARARPHYPLKYWHNGKITTLSKWRSGKVVKVSSLCWRVRPLHTRIFKRSTITAKSQTFFWSREWKMKSERYDNRQMCVTHTRCARSKAKTHKSEV